MAPPSQLHLAGCVIDLKRRVVVRGEVTTSLTVKEVEVLLYLADRPDEIVSRDELEREVWGFRAGVRSEAVPVAMRRLRGKLETDPSAPVNLLTVRGVGWRLVAQAADEPEPEVRSSSNLQPELDRFVGREGDILAIREMLAKEAPLVTLVGPPGVGKTRLARRIAGQMLEAGEVEEIWLVPLADVTDDMGLVAELGRAMGVNVSDDVDTAAAVRQLGRALARRDSAMVILDNFEHLVQSASQTVGLWQNMAPGLRMLVTSRERLRLAGESIHRVEPLPRADAVALLRERAAAIAGATQLSEMHTLEEIVDRLDGVPLAIELAAARMNVFSAPALLSRLENRFKLLRIGRRDANDRQATMQGALDWSWDLLETDERHALAQLSVFKGGFDAEAAEMVLDEPAERMTLDVVQSLRDKSLLRAWAPDRFPTELRLGMYESVRDYAIQKIDELDLRKATEARHNEWAVKRAERIARDYDRSLAADELDRLALDAQNLWAVLDRCEKGQPELAIRVGLVLGRLLRSRGPAALLKQLANQMMRHTSDLPADLRCRVRALVSLSLAKRNRFDEAVAMLELASKEAADVGETHTEAYVRWRLANLLLDGGTLDRATIEITRSAELMELHPDSPLVGGVLHTLASCHFHAGDHQSCKALLERCQRLASDVGNRRLQDFVLCSLAVCAWGMGDADAADDYDRRAETMRGISDPPRWGLAGVVGLGIQVGRRHPEQVRAYLEARSKRADHQSDPRAATVRQANYAQALYLDGDNAAAVQLLERIDDDMRRFLHPSLASYFGSYRGAALCGAGRFVEGRAVLQECLGRSAKNDDEYRTAVVELLFVEADLAEAAAAQMSGELLLFVERIDQARERLRLYGAQAGRFDQPVAEAEFIVHRLKARLERLGAATAIQSFM